jgi:Protein of unknown function (DUF3489)
MAKKVTKPVKQTGINKSAHIINLLKRPNGASVPELMKATTWQAHSVRGFLSGTLKKKQGLVIASTRDNGKNRRYRIEGLQ